MLPYEPRRGPRGGRAGHRTDLGPLERLEGRELLAYTGLGVSLPDLTLSGQAGPVAVYGGPLTLSVDVRNLGASSLTEPFNLTQGAPSNADAPPSQIGVFLSAEGGRRGIRIGTIDVPRVPQNSIVRVTQAVTIPTRAELIRRAPRRAQGLPADADGGTVFVTLRADVGRAVQEIDERNNTTGDAVPVRLFPRQLALPDLEGLTLDAPPQLRPGEVIQPTIQIANFGPVPSDFNQKVPVTAFLVASQDPFFGPGDAIVDRIDLGSIPGLSQAPSRSTVLGDVNLDPAPNITTLVRPAVMLPSTPQAYFLGLIVDPNDAIQEIGEVGRGPSPRLQQVRFVAGDGIGAAPDTRVNGPSIRLVKLTIGVNNNEPTGFALTIGSQAAFTYVVTNNGNMPLSDVSVTDDQGAIPVFQGGDVNDDGVLDLNETWIYTASATVVAGQYANVGTASASADDGTLVQASDLEFHFGVAQGNTFPIPPFGPIFPVAPTYGLVPVSTTDIGPGFEVTRGTSIPVAPNGPVPIFTSGGPVLTATPGGRRRARR